MRLSNPGGDSRVQEGASANNMDLPDTDIKMPFKVTIRSHKGHLET